MSGLVSSSAGSRSVPPSRWRTWLCLAWIDGPHGRVPVIGVPSASAAFGGDHDAAGYNLYRIDRRPGGWTCEVERRGLNAAGAVIECERFAV